jgi:thioredoxin-like negative regulator of GroEL
MIIPKIGEAYNVGSVPHFIIFKDGKPIARRHKTTTKQELKKFIDDTLQQQKKS